MADTPAPTETTDTADPLADVSLEEIFSDDAGEELLGEGTDGEGRSPEPTEADAPTEKTQPATPETPAEGAQTESDPETLLATATPLDFTVNGESKTFDGIQVIPGHGAIINEDQLPAVRDLLQKGQQAWDANRELYNRVQEYDRLEFKDAKGLDAFSQALTDNARLTAAVTLLVQHIEDPQRIVALATDPTALPLLQERLGVAIERAALTASKQWGERITASRETAPEQLTAILHQHFDGLARQVPELTQQDWAEAKTIFGPFAQQIVRKATPDDARSAGVKVGSLVVNNDAFRSWLESRAVQRTQETAAKAAADKTASENAKRLAAANAGKKPAQRRPAPAAPQPQQRRESDSDRKAREWSEQRNRMLLDGVVGSTVTDE